MTAFRPDPPEAAAPTATGPPELERVADYLDYHVARTPAAEAAVLGDLRLSYAELAERVDRCARALLGNGVTRGDRVAVLTTPRPEYLIIFLALARIGAVWVGLNPRHRFDELDQLVGDCEPVVLIALSEFRDRDYRADLAALLESHECIRRLVTLGPAAVDGASRFEDFLGEGAAVDGATLSSARDLVRSKDALCIVYTSGTTGSPKGAVLTHRSFVRCYTVQFTCWPVAPLRILSNLPVNHIGGLGDVGTYCLVGGGAQVFMERFDPAEVLAIIERERVSVWIQMVAQFQMCATLPEFETRDLSSLQLVAWGDAAMPKSLVKRLASKAVRVTNSYGLSEACGPLTMVEPGADLEVLSTTVGRPLPQYQIRLADADGKEVENGEPGEIQVHGDFVMAGYFRRPEATREAFTPDGWLHTGDLAEENPDGTYRLVGRLKDMYKSGGYNVYPREIEKVLVAHPAVSMAVVVGVPHPVYQEVGAAFVIAAPGATADEKEIERYCRDHLANYKIPKSFAFRREFPMLANGKVDKAALRQQALAGSLPEERRSEA